VNENASDISVTSFLMLDRRERAVGGSSQPKENVPNPPNADNADDSSISTLRPNITSCNIALSQLTLSQYSLLKLT